MESSSPEGIWCDGMPPDGGIYWGCGIIGCTGCDGGGWGIV